MAVLRQKIKDAEYLRRRSVVNEQTGCHEWIGAASSFGHGNINVDGKYWKVHRYAWTLARGAIPDGMCVCHHCDNPPCINPEHLFLGTRKDNSDDMYRKGRGRKSVGSGHWYSKFSDEDVRRIREAYLFGARQVDLAAAYGVHQTAISTVVRRQNWRHVE